MRLQRYSAYKSSGIDWIGEVPQSWELKRVREAATLLNGYAFNSDLFGTANGIPLVRIRDIKSTTTELVWTGAPVRSAEIKRGDILVGMDGDFNVSRWAGGYAMLNQRVCCIRAKTGRFDDRFLFYLLPFPLNGLNDVTYSTTVKHLSSLDLLKFRFYAPDVLEQRAVADFLDRETARLDTLVGKKRELIEKLKEKRTALISRTVTRGLNRTVRFKPSGIECLGDIPEHWESGNLRRYALMRTGHTPSRQVAEYWDDRAIPWFTLADVWQLRDDRVRYLGDTKEMISELGLANSAAELLPTGTVIFSRTASIGFSGIMPRPMATTQDFWNWVCGPKLKPEYLLLVFRAIRREFQRLVSGSTHKTIYQPDAASLRICVPPLLEQDAIVQYLDRETAKLDRMTEKVEAAIEKLQEYRTALITAAVTGKIDVREE